METTKKPDLALTEAEKKEMGQLVSKMQAAKCAFYDALHRQKELAAESQRVANQAAGFEREVEVMKAKIQERSDLLSGVRGVADTHRFDAMAMTFVPK